MIIGNLSGTRRAEALLPGLKELFAFVGKTDFDALPLGRIEVDGDRIFINNTLTDGADINTQPLEMHRQYVDVHILLGGEETIGWKPIHEIENYTQEYDAEKDCALSNDRPRFFATLHPGEFCIVFPEDTHAPAIGTGKIRKLIGKIKL